MITIQESIIDATAKNNGGNECYKGKIYYEFKFQFSADSSLSTVILWELRKN